MNVDLLQPKHLKSFCERYGLRPSKSYGQHYLISDAPVKKMIAAAELSKEDTVVEIGPGFGVLTLAVAPLVKKVIAFEIEQKLKPYWEEKQKEYPNVEIIWGNFLNQFDPKCYMFIAHRYKVLANLPYQITSDALRIMLEADPPPERVVVMVQKEVAIRMTAKPPKMSLLSVAVQYYGVPSLVAKVPAGSFWPAPKVESAAVAIRSVRRVSNEKEFFRIAHAGFAHKRKQLWRNLAAGLHLPPEQVKEAICAIGEKETARAEELSVEKWENLFLSLKKKKHDIHRQE